MLPKVISILLLACSALAQPFTFNDVAWGTRSSTVPTPRDIPGLAWWWVSSDLPVGITVSNWTDRIQGSIYTNGATAQQPTNSASGIYFNGTSYWLTNFNPVVTVPADRLWTFFFIIQPITVSGAFGVVVQNQGANGYWFLNSSKWYAGAANPVLDATTTLFDFVASVQDGTYNGSAYTNGIQASATMPNTVGSGDKFRFLAWDALNNRGNFYIREIGFFTNTITSNSVWVANLHKYATNTYPTISP